MIWILLVVAAYWGIGLILIHRSGWSDEFAINLKMAVLCGLGWPVIMVIDYFNSRDSGSPRNPPLG